MLIMQKNARNKGPTCKICKLQKQNLKKIAKKLQKYAVYFVSMFCIHENMHLPGTLLIMMAALAWAVVPVTLSLS